jgi:hypothetical protein
VTGTPLIQLEQGGSAPVLRYDIPEPTSYEGKNFIALSLDEDVFLPLAEEMPTAVAFRQLRDVPHAELRSHVASYLSSGVARLPALRSAAAPSVRARRGGTIARRGAGLRTGSPQPPTPPEPPPDGPDVDDIVDAILDGHMLVQGVLVDGTPTVDPVPVPEAPDPHLYLVESLRLTSFLGDYGAGRIVKTFTLLPGERTRISVRTFLQRESTRKEASSVLDSLTEESAIDLERSVTREQSDQSSYQSTKEYYAEGQASARWGWGSAKAKAGVKGSTNAAREESVKNVANATEKHAARASAKREVEVNTSYEESVRTEEELAMEREIENLNRSRTLNFVFRQMNQKFVTAVHLTDIRVAFFNGDRASRREVPLSRLDALLDDVVRPDKRADVRAAVLDQLTGIRDVGGNLVDVTRTVTLAPDDEYLEFDPQLASQVTDDAGRVFTVPGLLLKQDELVMRTEGVIVESLLGHGEALDGFAKQIQELEVARRRAEVDELAARADQLDVVNKTIRDGDQAAVDRAERLAMRCCPCPAKEEPPTGGVPPRPTDGPSDDG